MGSPLCDKNRTDKVLEGDKTTDTACGERERYLEDNVTLTALLLAGIEMLFLPTPPTQTHSHIVMNPRLTTTLFQQIQRAVGE